MVIQVVVLGDSNSQIKVFYTFQNFLNMLEQKGVTFTHIIECEIHVNHTCKTNCNTTLNY